MQRGSEALKDAYKNTVERIKGQQPGLRDLAQKVLAWITYSQRPLKVLELQHALAVELGDTELDADNINEESQMVSVCAGLITVDDKSKIIRFVHYTTQEFFENFEREWLSNAQLDISVSCVRYLSFDTFASGWCSTDELFELRLKESAFLDYAARYWGLHASYVETQIVGSMLSSFLTKEGNICCAAQTLCAPDYHFFNYSQQAPQQLTALHLLANFGLLQCFISFLDRPDLKDSHDRTPLSWAAGRGHETIIKLLLARDDVEADSKDKDDRTPLWWASVRGHETIVKLLLARDDVEADSKDKNYRTPLWWAAGRGHETIVKLLLARDDVEADSKDKYDRTPLSGAAEEGHETIVKLLLARDDVEADSKDKYDRTPLSWAAERGHETIVKLLLARDDVEADSKDKYDRTPLWWAAERGHETIMKLLLARDDVEADSKDKDDRTPLWGASVRGHETIVKLLLARDDVEADSKDKNYRTPLWGAAEEGHETIVKLLLERDDVEADSKDKDDRTLLSWAAEEGHETIVKWLLARDVEADSKDNCL
jgi:ankyrin repeat protein